MTWEAFLAFNLLETSTRDAFKRAPGDLLATNFAPKGVPIGAWGAFLKRQGGVLGLRNAQELPWWPSSRELGPQEPFPDGRIQPNCFRNA